MSGRTAIVLAVSIALAGVPSACGSERYSVLPAKSAGAYRTVSAICGDGGTAPTAHEIQEVKRALTVLGKQLQRTPDRKWLLDDSDKAAESLSNALADLRMDFVAEARCQEAWPTLVRYLRSVGK